MARKRQDDNLENKKYRIITNEEATLNYNKFCDSIGHRLTEKTYPSPEDWLFTDVLFTYLYDPKLKEYVNYIDSVGIFEFDNKFQIFCLVYSKLEYSNYVKSLIRTVTKVFNREVPPEEAIIEFDRKDIKKDELILI